MKKKKSLDVGILHEANDWVLKVEVDFGKQLKLPDFIAKTQDGKGFRCSVLSTLGKESCVVGVDGHGRGKDCRIADLEDQEI